ncbi:uracil phosphoribosyltransferase [Limibacter armeniacum]|uniref:uracil phosphoribosyltransferase n=1 Tax=Limibacter armeniacum TaxID=466084 RepID=UPI002FE5DD45
MKSEKLVVFDQQPSIVTQYLNELRNIDVQKDSMRFRENLKRIGEIMAYEMSKTFAFKPVDIQTPLAVAKSEEVQDQVVLTTILRAGLPLYDGFVRILDNAESAFVASYRAPAVHGEEVSINMEYVASGDLTDKVVILADPMLATGKSLLLAYKGLRKNGRPKHVHIAAVIASQQGVDYIMENMDDVPFTLWIGAIDPELNDKAYIIPGLGDAGDLCFGPKL